MFIIKTVISALIIAGASELAKHSSFWASILISLPLVSILTLSWVYLEQRNLELVQNLSTGILWAVIPSLLFFIALSAAIKLGMNFPISLLISIASTTVAYAGWIWILGKFGIQTIE